jgi:hypothetical protein
MPGSVQSWGHVPSLRASWVDENLGSGLVADVFGCLGSGEGRETGRPPFGTRRTGEQNRCHDACQGGRWERRIAESHPGVGGNPTREQKRTGVGVSAARSLLLVSLSRNLVDSW